MSASATANVLEGVKERIAQEGDPSRRIESLILGLADAIKATSNDQNVQRLSRELRAAAGEIAGMVAS